MDHDRRKFLKGTGVAALASLAGCTGGGDGDGGSNGTDGSPTGGGSATGTLKVGVLVPFSGEYAWVGANVFPVADMIATEINEAGGIDGKDVALVKGDTEAAPDASLSAAKKLVNVEGVEGIVGPTSLTFSAVVDFFQQNQVPVVSPTAGTTALDDVGGEYIYRTVPSDSLGGRAIAKAAREKKYNSVTSYERMGLMVGKAQALQSFKKPIRSSFQEYGGTVTKTLNFKTGKASYQSEVQTMLGSNPNIISLVASPEDSVKIMQAAYQAGYEGNWFVTQDQANAEFLKQTSEKVTDGILGLNEATFGKADEAGRIQQFNSRFKEFAGKEPGLFAKNTYDAMNVLGLSMKATVAAGASLNGKNVAGNVRAVANPPEKKVTTYTEGAKAIESDSKVDLDYQGLVGPINFDQDGDVTSPFAILKADGNEWTQVAKIPPSALKQ